MGERLELYWTDEDVADTAKATKFRELSAVACRIAARMPQPLCIVCGPITTGGLGSIEANLLRFKRAIDRLGRVGFSVFSQIPFEDALFEIKRSRIGDSATQLLDEFYRPLFESGMVRVMVFLPGWEREQAQKLGILIFDLCDL